MKLKLLNLMFAFFAITTSFGQTFSVELSGQYGKAILGHVETQNEILRYSVSSGGQVIFEREDGIFTLGDGFQGNLTLAAKISDNLSFRLKSSYFINTSKPTSDYKIVYAAGDEITNVVSSGNALLFAPMLTFQTDNDKALRPYMSIGIVGGVVNYKQVETTTFTGNVSIKEKEFSTPFSVGLAGQFGVSYSLNENLAIRGGLDFRVINFHPTSSSVVSYTENDENKLTQLTTYEKEIEYGNQYLYYTIDDDGHLVFEPNDDKPRESPSFPVPLSNVSLEIGVQYIF